MPEFGEIKQGPEIGRKNSTKFIFRPCEMCGQGQWIVLHKGKPLSQKCRSCANKSRGGMSPETHSKWKGGRCINTHGYVLIYLKTDDFFYPMATQGKTRHYVPEHRLVMAQSLGRNLQPWEIVHHKNGNKGDNRIENLELTAGLGEHSTQHSRGYKDGYAKGLIDGKDTQIQDLIKEVRLLRWQNAELLNKIGQAAI